MTNLTIYTNLEQALADYHSFQLHCTTLGLVALRECVYRNDNQFSDEEANAEFDSIVEVLCRLMTTYNMTNIKQIYNPDCYNAKKANMIYKVAKISIEDWFNVILEFDRDFMELLITDLQYDDSAYPSFKEEN